jgi:hypothetical protein
MFTFQYAYEAQKETNKRTMRWAESERLANRAMWSNTRSPFGFFIKMWWRTARPQPLTPVPELTSKALTVK